MTTLYTTGFVERRNQGGAFASIFENGVIDVYSGRQPASADEAPTGTLLAQITKDGGGWAPGFPTNGLQFIASGRYITKRPDHTWMLRGIAAGQAGWFRLRANPEDPATFSLTAPRIDGAVALIDSVGEYELLMVETAITADSLVLVPHWWHGTPPLN
ncbi:hypothetical protein D3C71_1048800 [compost metagenome]